MGSSLLAAGGTTATSDVVPIAVSVVATLVLVALTAGVVSLLRAGRELRASAEQLVEDTHRLLTEMAGAMDAADAQLGRVDELIGSAESISEAVGSASRLASAAVASPVIKVMAFGAGAKRAGRRLRQGPGGPRR
jgi:hypothetical protein